MTKIARGFPKHYTAKDNTKNYERIDFLSMIYKLFRSSFFSEVPSLLRLNYLKDNVGIETIDIQQSLCLIFLGLFLYSFPPYWPENQLQGSQFSRSHQFH